jgi:beta-lactamase regulating signal transducer with metallopeptidase domain
MLSIEQWNYWGAIFISFAKSMLWQSAVLIAVLALIDRIARKHLRAVTLYALWMLLLVKLMLPATFSLPTGIVRLAHLSRITPISRINPISPIHNTHSTPAPPASFLAPASLDAFPTPTTQTRPLPSHSQPRKVSPTLNAFLFLGWIAIAVVSISFLVVRWLQVRKLAARASKASRELEYLLNACRLELNLRRAITLRIADDNISLCLVGLLRLVILIPRHLSESLTATELRAILLHEAAHARRGDLYVSLAQSLLQIFYFYNPLLWWANSRIRALRELAVDEAVVVALGNQAVEYPSALVHVANLSRREPIIKVAAVGILEKPSHLGSRVRRLLDSPPPRSAKLGIGGLTAILILASILLPMAPAKASNQSGTPVDVRKSTSQNTVANPLPAITTANSPQEPVPNSDIKTGSLEQLFAEFVPYQKRQSRRQAAIESELMHRPQSRGFLLTFLKKDFSKPDASDAVQSRRKAAYLLGEEGQSAAEAVPLLLGCLEDNEDVREEVTMALGKIGPGAKDAIPSLIEELHFQNRAAAQALSIIAPGSEMVLNAILDAIEDPTKTSSFRAQTADSLSSMKVRSARLEKVIADLNRSPDLELRNAGERLSGHNGGSSIAAPESEMKYSSVDTTELMKRLEEWPDDPWAVNSLRMLGTNAAPALPLIMKLLEGSTNNNAEKLTELPIPPKFPENLVSLLGTIGPSAKKAVPLLIALTRSDRPGLCRNSIHVLGMLGPAANEAEGALRTLLNDPDRETKWDAARSLLQIDPNAVPECLPILLSGVDAPREYLPFHISVIGSLGEAARPLVPKLMKMLKENEYIRLAAANVIAKLAPEKRPEIVPLMIADIQDGAIMNPHLAAKVLGECGAAAAPALGILKQHFNNPNEYLAKACKEAVKKIEMAMNSAN